jgi:hypothetical protein
MVAFDTCTFDAWPEVTYVTRSVQDVDISCHWHLRSCAVVRCTLPAVYGTACIRRRTGTCTGYRGGFFAAYCNVLLGTTSRPPTTSPPKRSTHESKANQDGVLLRA